MDISRVKMNLGRKVIYKNNQYLFSGCIMRVDENGFYYQAELQDLSAMHSIAICRLEDLMEET